MALTAGTASGTTTSDTQLERHTALRLAGFLKTSPRFWMRLQADWDLQQALERAAS